MPPQLLGRASWVSPANLKCLKCLTCLLLLFSAELFFLSAYQWFSLMLLFHMIPFNAIGNFAVDLTGLASDLEVFNSSCRSLIILIAWYFLLCRLRVIKSWIQHLGTARHRAVHRFRVAFLLRYIHIPTLCSTEPFVLLLKQHESSFDELRSGLPCSVFLSSWQNTAVTLLAGFLLHLSVQSLSIPKYPVKTLSQSLERPHRIPSPGMKYVRNAPGALGGGRNWFKLAKYACLTTQGLKILFIFFF